MRSIPILLVSVVLTLTSAGTSAEQRALLVGVGKYSVPGIDLPGIDLDLERMRETLGLMGFEDSQIRTLLDDQATSRNVTREFRTWLREGVNPQDRIVFYYSGHGSNTPDFDGDESDGVDEVLVTHDVRRIMKNGKRALTGVVDDDTMAALIAGIPSTNIWIIVDACHSGTVTRDILLENLSLGAKPVYEKSFSYEGMPLGSEFVFDREFGTEGEPNFVSMSAAGDNEKALGTFSGGIFTIGLSKAIEEAAKNANSLTVNELRDRAAIYIREHVDESKVHHPQVTGSEKLANGALNIIPLAGGNGPNADGKQASFCHRRSRRADDEHPEERISQPGHCRLAGQRNGSVSESLPRGQRSIRRSIHYSNGHDGLRVAGSGATGPDPGRWICDQRSGQFL
jgi:hypothetical protein